MAVLLLFVVGFVTLVRPFVATYFSSEKYDMEKLRHTDSELKAKHEAIWENLDVSWKQFWTRKINVNTARFYDLFRKMEQDLSPLDQGDLDAYARLYGEFLSSYPELGSEVDYYLTDSAGKVYPATGALVQYQPQWQDLSHLKSVDMLLFLEPDSLSKAFVSTLEYSAYIGIAPDTRRAVLTFLFYNRAMEDQDIRFAMSLEMGKVFELARGFFQNFESQLNYLDNEQLKTTLLTFDEDDSMSFFFKTYGQKNLLDKYGLSSGFLSSNRNIIYQDMAEVILRMIRPIDVYELAEPSLNFLIGAGNKEQRGKRLDLELQIRGYMEPLIVSNIYSSLESKDNYSAQITSIGKIYMLPKGKNIIFIDSIVEDSWWTASEFVDRTFLRKFRNIILLFLIAGLLILTPLFIYAFFMRLYARDFFRIGNYIDRIPVVEELVEKEESRLVEKLTAYKEKPDSSSRMSEKVIYDLQNRLIQLVKAVDYWREQSSMDELTGLLNRKGLNQICAHEFNRMKRSGSPFSLILLDIDRFKQVNDDYGHEVGDLVLKSLTNSLASTFRVSDYLGRWGGEEFLIVLPDTSLKGAIQVAEGARSSVEKIIIQTKEASLHLTISLGVATSMGDITFNDILNFADKSLYKAKEHGRNQTWGYNEEKDYFPVSKNQRENERSTFEKI